MRQERGGQLVPGAQGPVKGGGHRHRRLLPRRPRGRARAGQRAWAIVVVYLEDQRTPRRRSTRSSPRTAGSSPSAPTSPTTSSRAPVRRVDRRVRRRRRRRPHHDEQRLLLYRHAARQLRGRRDRQRLRRRRVDAGRRTPVARARHHASAAAPPDELLAFLDRWRASCRLRSRRTSRVARCPPSGGWGSSAGHASANASTDARPGARRSERRPGDPRRAGHREDRAAALRRAAGFGPANREVEGVQAEMELPFAAIHRLCAPMLDGLEALAEPQRNALDVALGVSSGDAPDRFLVAVAVLNLLCRDRRGAPAALPRGRRAVARRRLGAGARVRRAAAAGGTGGDGVLAARAEPPPGARRPAAAVARRPREPDARALLSRPYRAGSTTASATGSSPRPGQSAGAGGAVAEHEPRRSEPGASRRPRRAIFRVGSRSSTCGASPRCPRRRSD